ncbi:NAD(P)-dependent oxidoreductase [Verrucomicrobiota bacterium]|nr:NAD(P)-dependent oxidoreductase [Verrucomicrobiota bacterium]
MLGHQLWRCLSREHEVWVTLRRPVAAYAAHALFDPARSSTGIDAANMESLLSVFRAARPQAVVNCIGIIKQLKEAQNPLASLTINSLLPHRVAALCALNGARLIHISTDCVFSGKRGAYTEDDVSDAEDIYGRTKFLGELHEPHCLTLRTSIIGRELETKSGLIEWFLGQQGRAIKGYRRASYTGLTTLVLARVIENVLVKHPDLAGLWQVSSDRISKYELLCLARDAFRWRGEISPDDSFVCDRSLDSSRFRRATGFVAPGWTTMLDELARAPK